MKTKSLMLFLLAMLCCAVLLTACGKVHTHTYHDEWTYDETDHWHAASCEHTDQTSDRAPHDFDGGVETVSGVRYTCRVCGYFKSEQSRYTVTAEEYVSAFEKIIDDSYRMDCMDGYNDIFGLIDDVIYVEDSELAVYYTYDGSVCRSYKKDGDEWVSETTSYDYYWYFRSGVDLLTARFKNRFADLSYDPETKTYVGTIVLDEEGMTITLKDVSVAFENKELKTVSYVVEDVMEEGTTTTRYRYGEFGKVSVELPTANIHEHTFSDEWSFDDYSHYHRSTCRHNLTADEERHQWADGICSVCGLNVLELSEDGKTVIGVRDWEVSAVTFPAGVTAIGNNAFEDCIFLVELTIPQGVTSIGRSAFVGCSALTRISLSEGLLTIDERAFYNCTALTSVTIPSTVATIGMVTFDGCENLQTVVFSEGVCTISYLAFKNCGKLTDVVIPKSIVAIGNDAFDVAAISRVFYGGTPDEWADINIGSSNNKLNGATLYFYSETEPQESGRFWHYDENGGIAVWHEHTFSDSWSYSETEHWHAATCGNDGYSADKAAHNMADGQCTVCGYSAPQPSGEEKTN